MKIKVLAIVGVSLLALMLAAIPLMAACGEEEEQPQEVIELIYATPYSPDMFLGKAAQVWMDYVEEETNGQVHFAPYWNGTFLTPLEAYAELAAGAADVADLNAHYRPDLFPMTVSLGYFFHGCQDTEIAARIYDEIQEKFPELRAEGSDVYFIAASKGAPPYQCMTTKIPVRDLDDFVGLSIRTISMHTAGFQALGAVPIEISTPDIYVSLQKGIIDGCAASWDAVKGFSLHELVNYVTILNICAGSIPTLAFNWDSWNSLPPEIQEVIEDSVEVYESAVMTFWAEEAEEGYNLAIDAGIEVIQLTEEDLQEVHAAFIDEAIRKAAEFDDMGLPGTELYNEIQRLIQEYS